MNIYVGNLNYEIEEQDLKKLFETYGEVSSSKIIKDKYTGRSKGFGFVVMDKSGEAEKAISELNNKKINEREIVVNEAKPKNEGFFRK
ncbi:MAG: RNA-binding protein [Bacteroidales bacterium]|nr:RNA-binding protein [Bacteroidales bacterium]